MNAVCNLDQPWWRFVIWTSGANDNTCMKYLESVLQATFIGTSYSTVHGTIAVYEYDTIRIGTLAYAF